MEGKGDVEGLESARLKLAGKDEIEGRSKKEEGLEWSGVGEEKKGGEWWGREVGRSERVRKKEGVKEGGKGEVRGAARCVLYYYNTSWQGRRGALPLHPSG